MAYLENLLNFTNIFSLFSFRKFHHLNWKFALQNQVVFKNSFFERTFNDFKLESPICIPAFDPNLRYFNSVQAGWKFGMKSDEKLAIKLK